MVIAIAAAIMIAGGARGLFEEAVKAMGASAIEPRRFRDTMGRFASGITIIGGVTDDGLAGFACQSFCSVSCEPALISFCVMKSSTSWPRIRPLGRFSVNVLADGQEKVSQSFARSDAPKWASVPWTSSPGGNPLVAASLMWLDCTVFAEHEAGDHYIVIGEVKDMSPPEWHPTGAPLIYFRGHYRRLHHGATSEARS